MPTIRAVRGDELDSTLGQPRIQRIAVVAAVADDPRRQLAQEPMFECVFDQRYFTGIGTRDSDGERKTSTVCDCHDLGAFSFAGEADGEAPFFAPAKVASMKASLKSYPPAVATSRAKCTSTRYIVPLLAQS
jgi:hypothetical protein